MLQEKEKIEQNDKRLTGMVAVHADDLGINNEITDKIIYCINNGLITSTSIVCNTEGFEYAVGKYLTNVAPFYLRLHINLVEGKPVTPAEEVPLLVNKQGEFRYSFFTLWMKYLFSSQRTKIALIHQIRSEIVNQLRKFKNAIGQGAIIGIDSHTHLHMIPFVLNIILRLSDSEPIAFIRLPREKFYFSIKDVCNYCSLNIIKHIVLNILCLCQHRKIRKRGIKTNSYFIGVLATGRMTISSVRAALKQLKRKGENLSVEILFHPGGVANKETVTWTNKNGFKRYYASVNRKKEANILQGVGLKKIIVLSDFAL